MRLIDFPAPLEITNLTWLGGPAARNSGSNTAMDGAEQTFSTVGSVVAFSLSFDLKMGRSARIERGALTALMNGMNAVRFTFYDPDIMTPSEAGLNVNEGVEWNNIPAETWSNGERWSNGKGWTVSPPVVAVSADCPSGATVVSLSNEFWGHGLTLGSYIGFFPFHFGLYMVTEVMGGGKYRIWPELRKSLTPNDLATLVPTLVMRTRPGGYQLNRGAVHTEGQSVELFEVHDYYVRQYFEG
jgi:hypothetical protein